MSTTSMSSKFSSQHTGFLYAPIIFLFFLYTNASMDENVRIDSYNYNQVLLLLIYQ